MDKDALVGWFFGTVIILGVAATIVIGWNWGTQLQITYMKACTQTNRRVLYDLVGGNLVQECK